MGAQWGSDDGRHVLYLAIAQLTPTLAGLTIFLS